MASKREEAKHREDVKKMTDDELAIELVNERNRLFSLRSASVTEKVEDVSKFGKCKRNIARVITEQAHRRAKSGSQLAAPAPLSPAATKPGKKKTTRKAAKAGAR